MGSKTTEESKSKPNRIWRRIQLMFYNNLPSWFRRVATWSDYILNIYVYTGRPALFSASLLFIQWVKLMQTLITDPRLKIRNCKGQPHQDISVTTTPICQGSGSLQMRKQKECKSHWWRLKLGKAVFWPWQSYCTHELCGDLQKACTRSRQPKFQRERERYAQRPIPDRGSTGSVCWGRESYSLEVCGHW